MSKKNDPFAFISKLPRNQSILVNDFIDNLTAYLTSTNSSDLSVINQLSIDASTYLDNIVSTNNDLKNELTSRLKHKSMADIIKNISLAVKQRIERILSTDLYSHLLQKYKPYKDIYSYISNLSLFCPVSINNIASTQLNKEELENHNFYSEYINDALSELTSKSPTTLEDVINTYLKVMSDIEEKDYLDQSTTLVQKLKDALNSTNASNSFSKEVLPLLRSNIDLLVKTFIDNKLPLNQLSQLSLKPVFNYCENNIQDWLLKQVQKFKSTVVKDKYDFFKQLTNLHLDVNIVLECPRICREIRRKISLTYKNSNKIKPIEIRLLTQDTTYKKGDSIYVKGLGTRKRDIAIIDYDGELIRAHNPSEHHQDIMKWYDPDNEKINTCRAWIEQYNEVAVIVALIADIETVKADCLKEGFKKVVYYDVDAAPDGSPVNKVVLARRLMRKCC